MAKDKGLISEKEARRQLRKLGKGRVPPLWEDQQKAIEIRAKLGAKLQEVCLILDEAQLGGLAVSFNLRASPGVPNRMLVDGIAINRLL